MTQPDLILVISDLNIPHKVNELPTHFTELFNQAKLTHVICLGNIGNKDVYEYFKSLSKNFYCVKGDCEDENLVSEFNISDSKTIKVGGFKIGMIHGHQIVPWGDLYSLSAKRKTLDCDILLHGFTGISSFYTFEGKHYINPGTLTSSYSPINPSPVTAFTVLLIDDDTGVAYKYEQKDIQKKIEISKIEFKKLAEENYQPDNDEE